MSGKIQVFRYCDGGFCLSQITGQFDGCVSAWFKPDGSMLEAEQYCGGAGKFGRSVKKGCAVWTEVAAVGRAYVLPASEIGV